MFASIVDLVDRYLHDCGPSCLPVLLVLIPPLSPGMTNREITSVWRVGGHGVRFCLEGRCSPHPCLRAETGVSVRPLGPTAWAKAITSPPNPNRCRRFGAIFRTREHREGQPYTNLPRSNRAFILARETVLQGGVVCGGYGRPMSSFRGRSALIREMTASPRYDLGEG
jgi:hypothetical protein